MLYAADPGAVAPEYKTTGSAGADLRALIRGTLTLAPGERAAVPQNRNILSDDLNRKNVHLSQKGLIICGCQSQTCPNLDSSE